MEIPKSDMSLLERKFDKNKSKCTSIGWVWTSGEDFTMIESGGNVADYKDGEWIDKY